MLISNLDLCGFFPVSIAHVLSITHLVPDNIVHFVEKKVINLPFFSLVPFLGEYSSQV